MKRFPHFLGFLLALLLFTKTSFSQVVYHDIKKSTVYEFLDEMANLQLIDLNTLIQPYSRKLIAQKLSEIEKTNLNQRQQQDLKFFLKDFFQTFSRN